MEAGMLDVRLAARYLRVSEFTLRKLARQRRLPAFKVGGGWRFKKEMLDSWAESQAGPVEHSHLPPRRKTRLLVIDDNASIHEALRLLLEPENVAVQSALNGPEGIRSMREQPADLVFLDLKMPGMDGPEVLAELRKSWPETIVVIVTAYPDSSLMQRALELGPVPVVSKPFTEEQILECLHKYGPRRGALAS